MSKKPAFTGLWKCFRRVCFCNYEGNFETPGRVRGS
jgi:hypothetical protein